MTDRLARLHVQSWAGCSNDPVTVVGETPKRYRIRNDGPKAIMLAGRSRSLKPGETVLVPKRAITFDTDSRT